MAEIAYPCPHANIVRPEALGDPRAFGTCEDCGRKLYLTARGPKTWWQHAFTEVAPDVIPGEGSFLYPFVQVMAQAQIGRECTIGHGCLIGRHARLGNQVKLKGHVTVGSGQPDQFVVLEDKVFIANNTVILTGFDSSLKECRGVTLKEGCSIGANCVIAPGVIVGRFAQVLSGTLVNSHVPDYTIVAGQVQPARKVGETCPVCFQQTRGLGMHVCPKKG